LLVDDGDDFLEHIKAAIAANDDANEAVLNGSVSKSVTPLLQAQDHHAASERSRMTSQELVDQAATLLRKKRNSTAANNGTSERAAPDAAAAAVDWVFEEEEEPAAAGAASTADATVPAAIDHIVAPPERVGVTQEGA
jgi:hypothetical protein